MFCWIIIRRIKLGLGKEFSTGLTSVALSRVRTSDGIMIVEHRFGDYARRHPRNI